MKKLFAGGLIVMVGAALYLAATAGMEWISTGGPGGQMMESHVVMGAVATVLGPILITAGLAWWVWAVMVRPRSSTFTAKGIRFALSPEDNALRVWLGDSQEPTFYPYGSLLFEAKTQTTTVTRRYSTSGSVTTVTGSNMATLHAPQTTTVEQEVPTGQVRLKFSEVVVDEFQPDGIIPVRKGSEEFRVVDASSASAAQRWLKAHRKLVEFDWEATKARLEKEREQALRVVRAACGVKPNKVLEAVAWTPKRASQVGGYFAMTEDGQGILWTERGVEKLSLDDLRARWERTGAYEKPTFKVSTPTGDCRVEWTADMGKRVERLSRKR